MKSAKLQLMAAIVLGITSLNVMAGDFNGQTPLVGNTGKIIEINRYKISADVDPDTVGLPRQFVIDFEAKQLRPSKESRVTKNIRFKKVVHIENKLIVQGVDEGIEGVADGLAWSLTISKDNGKAVLSASGDGVAYVVFGECAPLKGIR
jgi:hypothetical protein